MTAKPKTRRRWFQFRLRTLLIVTAILAVPLAWLAHERQKVRERNEWLESLAKRVSIEYSSAPPERPAWLRYLLDEGKSPADITKIMFITYPDGNFTDDDLAHLPECPKLEVLRMNRCQVTDTGLVHLTGLKKLRIVDLSQVNLTDAGIVHLASITNLEELYLSETQMTAFGRKKLRQVLPNVSVYADP